VDGDITSTHDIFELPIIDSHCHGFLLDEASESFEQNLKLTPLTIPKHDMVNTFLYRQTIRELSRVLECTGNHEEIVSIRNDRYREEPVDYIKLLFEDAKITDILMDTGYPYKEFAGYSIGVKEFSRIVPCKVHEIFRIDNVVMDAVKEGTSFNRVVNEFHRKIREAVKKGVVSLKTTIAYTSGLDIKRCQEGEVKRSYQFMLEEMKAGKSVRDIFYSGSHHVKNVMDFFVYLGLENSVNHDIPFQIHVGMGNPTKIDLRQENPVLLTDLLGEEKVQKAKIILIHGGYPYVEEAGFITNANPNVFLDISAVSPFISIGVKDKLLNLLEMTPTTKIMHGSDGHRIPELFWIAAIRTKRAISQVFRQLLDLSELDHEWASEIAPQILSGNAERVYKL
jgi:predicted TIM-barrel fold metal-dependent hydrolase